ncbi:MAG: conserved phage C-terminal domain-containing protein [Monoglobaceae bacterium]
MSESRIRDENYYQIQGWMINRLGLKGVALSVYAIIYGFSQDGENEYTGSLQYLCDFCGGVSKPTIIKALKDLTESGFIIRREEVINNVLFTRYKADYTAVKKLDGGSKETLPGVVKNFNRGSKETLPNNNIHNKSINNKDNKSIVNQVIGHLNDRAGTRYKTKAQNTQRYINARLKEGFTVEDFIIVIDKKCAEWKGTNMEKYLRPETLFGSKFESYLNAPIEHRKKYGENGVEIGQQESDDLDGIL